MILRRSSPYVSERPWTGLDCTHGLLGDVLALVRLWFPSAAVTRLVGTHPSDRVGTSRSCAWVGALGRWLLVLLADRRVVRLSLGAGGAASRARPLARLGAWAARMTSATLEEFG